MQNFQVNLQGMITLLSKNLYSSDQVFIRELLQNAVDAITARKTEQGEFSPQITIAYLDGEVPQLVFTDNGIGLSESEVHQFLTTIGASTKRMSVVNQKEFIGQFGIGLLSCFMITNQIIMTTQSVDTDYALQWTGYDDGTFKMERMPALSEPGTSVYIHLPKRQATIFTADRVGELLEKFGGFLRYPITYVQPDIDKAVAVNSSFALFADLDKHDEVDLLRFGEKLFGETFLAAIPLSLPSGQTRGVAYIRDRASLGSAQSNRVYVKDMFLADSVDNLLPDWAYFLRAVVNTSVLTPTASRERLYQDDALAKTRKQMGRLIRNWLIRLVREDPERARVIIDHHQKNLKEMAAQEPEFLKIMVPFLRFPTTQGLLTIGQIREKSGHIEYVHDEEAYQQIRYLCSTMDRLVVHTRYDNDQEIMRKLARLFPDWVFQPVDVGTFLERLGDVDPKVAERAAPFLAEANHILQDTSCRILLKSFEPKHIPTLYYLPDDARSLRQLDKYTPPGKGTWGKLKNILQDYLDGSRPLMCMNASNPLINNLLGIEDPVLRGALVRFLYVQALLLGNYTLREQEMVQFSDALADLIIHAKTS